MTGPNPVDRGKPGSKIHVVSDRAGLPMAVGVSAANLHDSQALRPMLMAVPRIRSRRGPRRSRRGPRRSRPAKLHADKAYDIDHHRRWLRHRGIVPRIARKGIESSERLGRHRWVVGTHGFVADRLPPPGHPLRTPRRQPTAASSPSPQH